MASIVEAVATNILGVSGRAMLQALMTSTHDPDILADARAAYRRVLDGCHYVALLAHKQRAPESRALFKLAW